MNEDFRNILEIIPWLTNVSQKTIKCLQINYRIQMFPSGTILFEMGDIPDFLYVTLSGTIEIFARGAGENEVVVEIASAPNAQTVASVLTGAPYIVSGKIIKSAKILMLDAPSLRRCVKNDPQLALNFIGLLAWQFRIMVRQAAILKTKPTAERLGCYLLSLAKEDGPAKVELPHGRRRVAGQLGMTTMSLSRAFKTLAECGVRVSGIVVEITDPDKLRAYCRPDHLINEPERLLTFLDD